jgi:hypothetical protein
VSRKFYLIKICEGGFPIKSYFANKKGRKEKAWKKQKNSVKRNAN